MFCGFNLHFPDGYEAEHLFMCLFTIHLLFLWKKLCRYFSSFIDLFVLLLRCKISLYILYPSFCHICVLEIFSSNSCLSSHCLNCIFWRTDNFIWSCNPNYLFLLFMFHAFCIAFKKSLCSLRSPSFFLIN